MITQEEIFAEVKNTFRSYDEYNLIDEISLRDWMIPELKRFGNNVMVMAEDVLKVENNKAILPDDFWMLEDIVRYYPEAYCSKDPLPIEIQRWVEQHNLKNDCGCKSNVKKEYINGFSQFYVYYSRPTALKIGRGTDNRIINKKCLNLPNNTLYDVVNIRGKYIHTEFKEGNIYIKFRALPTDEEGKVAIPSTQHDALYKYIVSYLEYRVMRDMFLNNDDQNVINKLQLLQQEKDSNFLLAMTESKAGLFSKESWKNVRNSNRRRKHAIESITPKINF